MSAKRHGVTGRGWLRALLWVGLVMVLVGSWGCASRTKVKPEQPAGPSAERLRRELPGEWLLELPADTQPSKLRLTLKPDGTFSVKEVWLLAEVPGGHGNWRVEGSDLLLNLETGGGAQALGAVQPKTLNLAITFIGHRFFGCKDARGGSCLAHRVMPAVDPVRSPDATAR